MHVIHTSVLVSQINVSDSQSRKSCCAFVSLSFLRSFLFFFFFSHMRVPDFTRISGDFPATNGSILIRRIFQRDKSNRTNWTRKCSYIFPYLRLRNRFRITPNKLGHAVFSSYLHVSRGFPEPETKQACFAFLSISKYHDVNCGL